MLYCLLYLLCPRMYHDLFVCDRARDRRRLVDRFPGASSALDEFEDLYKDRPLFEEVPL